VVLNDQHTETVVKGIDQHTSTGIVMVDAVAGEQIDTQD
jgi:hypothetical protein